MPHPRPFFKSTLSCLLSLMLLASWSALPGYAQGTRVTSNKSSRSGRGVEQSSPAATYVVNSTADPGDGTCNATECTLREAIAASNASVGTLDTINFQIGSGVQTIIPLSALPQITDPVVIDATTQPGFAGTPIIELNGASAGGVAGLFINAGSSTVRGLVINRFDVGIRIDVKGSNIIEGNYIGTNVSGNVALPNTSGGITIGNSDMFGFGQTNNRIGGTTPAQRNVISGNGGSGISLSGNLAQGTSGGHVFTGNYIGTNAGGNGPLGNSGNGITISFNVSYAEVTNNVISGNGGHGVSSLSSNTFAYLAGNFIGTNFDGTSAMGNAGFGVMGGSSRTQGLRVGGTTPDLRNIISNNGMGGVSANCADPATACTVQGNYIGTDVTGSIAMGNHGDGVTFSGGTNSTLGGTTAGAGNVIASNTGNGISLNPVSNAGGGFVQGNRIGTNAAGTAPLGNGQNGINATDNSFNYTIGGTASGAGNIIAFNNGKGVVTKSFPSGHTILSNSIYSNANLGIDLFDNGVTANDDCDGGGSGSTALQNYPVITSVSTAGGSTTIQGTLNSKPSQTYTLQFFSNTTCDPSGFGEGENLLGSTTVTTDASCVASFNVTFPVPVSAGQSITATATNPSNWTSEFSQCRPFGLVIAGKITSLSGIALKGVSVNLSGSQTATTQTDINGNYSFAVMPGGSYTVTPGRRLLIYSPSSRTFNNLNGDQPGADFTARLRQPSDFDGEGKTDVAVWRPSTGDWDYLESSTGLFKKQPDWGRGSLGDIPVPGDYDGDGRTDFAIWRPSEGNWYIIKSSNGAIEIDNWGGGSGDVPAPADFDGDGKTDLVVFRKTEGNWYIRHSSNGVIRVQGWGNSTDKLVFHRNEFVG